MCDATLNLGDGDPPRRDLGENSRKRPSMQARWRSGTKVRDGVGLVPAERAWDLFLAWLLL